METTQKVKIFLRTIIIGWLAISLIWSIYVGVAHGVKAPIHLFWMIGLIIDIIIVIAYIFIGLYIFIDWVFRNEY